MNKREKGFSLIELLIVVAIILIIAAIAIPNLLRARIAANQSSAAASLRTLGSAAAMYQTTYSDGYPGTIAVMTPPVAPATPDCTKAGLVDNIFAAVPAVKSGYTFGWLSGASVVAAPPVGCAAGFTDMFSATATPVSSSSGTVSYCVDASNVIRQNLNTGLAAPIAIIPVAGTGCPTTDGAIGN